MQGSVTLEISLFGAFRNYAEGTPLILNVPVNLQLVELKKRIGEALQSRLPAFDQHRLIEESALADEKAILPDDYVVTRDAVLALLPPVCGG